MPALVGNERISLSSAGHQLREGFLASVTEVAKNSLDASLNTPQVSLHASAALLTSAVHVLPVAATFADLYE